MSLFRSSEEYITGSDRQNLPRAGIEFEQSLLVNTYEPSHDRTVRKIHGDLLADTASYIEPVPADFSNAPALIP